MIKLIAKLFIKNHNAPKDPEVRESYCTLSGILGIICNVVLFAVKLLVGTAVGSVAVTSDAFNNLADLGSSVVGLVGTKMSRKKPDRDHPFGHGRIEYISALIISFLILIMAFELGTSSVQKLFSPSEVNIDLVPLILLILSVGVKLWMYSYNRYIGKITDAQTVKAVSKDSLSDVLSTSVVIISAVASKYVPAFPLDAVCGLLVSLLIAKNGIGLVFETIRPLLGTPPTKETVDTLSRLICDAENVVGIHDLIVHDYGPGRVFASVHAEVPDTVNIVSMHEIIDMTEMKVLDETGIELVIHMDPISTECEKTVSMRENAKEILRSLSPECSLHDFRITDGEENINVLFDLAVPADMPASERGSLVSALERELKKCDPRYAVKIHIDDLFT
ncbi:MAG: cation transporter [Clostridia bacterium]|nr:cation transporter [Clostridia bacterium]